MINTDKLPDHKMLEKAYDYQHYKKKEFINATIWLYKLLIEYPNSEYLNIAKQRIAEMGIPSEVAENEFRKIELAKINELNKLKQSIPCNLIELLKIYEGKYIAINHNKPTNYDKSLLIKVNDEFFSILLSGGNLYHIPYRYIISIAEINNDGNNNIVVQIFHQIIPQGTGSGVGVGFGVLFDFDQIFNGL